MGWLDDNIRESRRELNTKAKRLDLESFCDVMQQFIDKSKCGMLVTKEENSKEWKVQGAGCGNVMDFFIWLNALEVLYKGMLEEMERAGGVEIEKMADALSGLIRQDMVKIGEEYQKAKEKKE